MYPKQWDASGRYTPVLTNVTNMAASTSAVCNWSRSGRVVTVAGQITLDPTTTAVSSEVGISLPIPSAFTAITDCAGTACATVVKESGGITADAANDRAALKWLPTDVASRLYAFTFSYYVL